MSWLIRDCLRSRPNRRFLQNILRRDPITLCATERAVSAARFLDKWDEEIVPSYNPKSFYPARIGETLNKTYRLVTKIGFGTTSTVWLAADIRQWWWKRDYVALKISANNLSPESTGHEVAISTHISNSGILHPGRQFVRMPIDTFELQGPHGIHPVLVYDLMREPLYVLRERCVGERFGANVVKQLLGLTLIGLDFLHNECRVVHGDLNTENIMIPIESRGAFYRFVGDGCATPPQRVGPDGRVTYLSHIAGGVESSGLVGPPKIIDFSASTLRAGEPILKPQLTRYRAPEHLLGAPFSYAADIWNLGLMTWELLEGNELLEVSDPPNGERTEQMQLAEIIGLLGPPPEAFRSKGSKSHLFFDSKGDFKFPELVPKPEKLKKRVGSLTKKEKAPFLDFLRSMLVWDPAKRKSAQELLNHPWLTQVSVSDHDPLLG